MEAGTWVTPAQLAQFASPPPPSRRRSSRDRDMPSRRAASDRLPPVAASMARAAARWISASVAGKGTGAAEAGDTRPGSSSATAKLPGGDSRMARSRSEERRVGKECRAGGAGDQGEKEGRGDG